jgi:hypothetical protein
MGIADPNEMKLSGDIEQGNTHMLHLNPRRSIAWLSYQ